MALINLMIEHVTLNDFETPLSSNQKISPFSTVTAQVQVQLIKVSLI